MDLYKIKGNTDNKIYKLIENFDVNLTTTHYINGSEYKSETHYVLENIDDSSDIVTVAISETLVHE